MRGKTSKKLNKLAKLLELTPAERRKLKKDFQKTVGHNLPELNARLERVAATNDTIES